MLVDNVNILIKAGNGGNGALSFKRNAQTAKGGPDGGNGGNGGSVYFQGINDITALSIFRYKKSLKAEDGVSGGKNNLYGRNGKDLTIRVPIGTSITDNKTNQTIEIKDDKNTVLLAKGGKGGRGNREFRTATNQAPRERELGEKGEEKNLLLEMRLIADIGLIGLPNAGKSSLLAVLTHANPKIGDYPFTTLEPNLGVMDKIVIADIPGLIEGAHTGRGLGIEFLRHVEKTKVLVHCIDSTEIDLIKAYETVRNELGLYSKSLLELPEIILLTKIDLVDNEKFKKRIEDFKKKMLQSYSSSEQSESRSSNNEAMKQFNNDVLPISIYNPESLDQLKSLISKKLI